MGLQKHVRILKLKFKITTDTFVGKIIEEVCFINSTFLLDIFVVIEG